MNLPTWIIPVFLLCSLPVIALSWRSLGSARNHGFFRFFAWEIMLWMLLSNANRWFSHPFSWNQVLSWILLAASLFPVLGGLRQFRDMGRISRERHSPELFGFEKTTSLITTGVYRYIRHPMYSSLLMLNWGIALKNPNLPILLFALLATFFLYLTVRAEERENLAYFGEAYRHYMKTTKRFVPWLW